MQKFFLLALILALQCFTISTVHAGIGDFFEKITDVDKIKEKIADEIKNLEIDANVKLIDADIVDGVGLGIQYRYELEPSYKAGFYTRADRWKFGATLGPDALLRAVDLPISIRFNPGVEIYYVRQFKTQLEAATAIPYTPAKLPLNAKKALENLNPGDFVAIPTHLNLVMSAGMANTNNGVSVGASTHYILSGKFMVHLYRLKNNKMRMKIIATRDKAVGGSVGAKFDLKIFGVNLVDKAIKKIFEMDIAKFSANMKWGDLFMLDYVLDLNHEQAKLAYNRVLASTLTFKNLTVANPFADNKDLENQIVTDLTLLEKIRKADLNKENPRVERLFRGKNEFHQKSSNFKVGLLVARYERKKIYTQNHIVSYDQHDVPTHFGFNNYAFHKGSKMFWGLFRKDSIFSTSTLLPKDTEGNVTGFSDLGISLDIRDKRFLYAEIQEGFKHTQRSLSPEIFNKIDFLDFPKVKFWQRVDHARIYHQIFLHEAAVRTYMGLNTKNLRFRLRDYVQTVPMPFVNDPHDDHNNRPNWENWMRRYSSSIKQFLNGLKSAFQAPGANDSEKFAHFEKEIMELRNNRAFQTIGTGFLISLLPPDKKEELVHVNVAWDAENLRPVRFQFGENPKSQMYKNLEYIQSVLNNRGFDLRLIEDQRKSGKAESVQTLQKENFLQLHK